MKGSITDLVHGVLEKGKKAYAYLTLQDITHKYRADCQIASEVGLKRPSYPLNDAFTRVLPTALAACSVAWFVHGERGMGIAALLGSAYFYCDDIKSTGAKNVQTNTANDDSGTPWQEIESVYVPPMSAVQIPSSAYTGASRGNALVKSNRASVPTQPLVGEFMDVFAKRAEPLYADKLAMYTKNLAAQPVEASVAFRGVINTQLQRAIRREDFENAVHYRDALKHIDDCVLKIL
jgi:hypothetical protein